MAMAKPGRLGAEAEDRFWRGVAFAQRFFMGQAEVQQALLKLSRTLDELKIPYAIVGAMALNEFGYQRTTVDVDVLLTAEGLESLKAHAVGRGYTEKFPSSRGLRDPEHGVDIDVVLAGTYPGDGKPKPVVFPDPAQAAQRGGRVSLLPLETLIELKLASGMTAPHRLRDLADVQELIRIQKLPRGFADTLNDFVRGKFLELWSSVHDHPD
jgi:hypothetical protein